MIFENDYGSLKVSNAAFPLYESWKYGVNFSSDFSVITVVKFNLVSVGYATFLGCFSPTVGGLHRRGLTTSDRVTES